MLEARLRESELIKSLRPVHNRRLRRSRELCSWCWSADADGYRPPRLALLDERMPDTEDLPHWGLFRTRRQARETLRKLARERGLCPRRLGLETGRGACFGSQLGHCAGVCAGRESAAQHDLRLLEALAGLRRVVWPYAGAVGLRERAADGSVRAMHVIDRWRWLGCLEEVEIPPDPALATRQPLDLDHYRILAAALRRARPGDVVPLVRAGQGANGSSPRGETW